MKRKLYRRIIRLVYRAARIAQRIGVSNLLQPGLVKEMIIADILGHELIPSKRDSDARSPQNPAEKYEYLSCLEGGSGQLDRMFREPADKREQSLERIMRNKKIYLAVFYKSDPLRCKVIYELEPAVVRKEAEKQLESSTNVISHVGFSEKWAVQNGRVVYRDGSITHIGV